MDKYINIPFILFKFDCITLISNILSNEFNIKNRLNDYKRIYRTRDAISLGYETVDKYVYSCFIKEKFVDITDKKEYKQGDVIVSYDQNSCITNAALYISDDKVYTFTLEGKNSKSIIKKIQEIDKIKYIFRHISLL